MTTPREPATLRRAARSSRSTLAVCWRTSQMAGKPKCPCGRIVELEDGRGRCPECGRVLKVRGRRPPAAEQKPHALGDPAEVVFFSDRSPILTVSTRPVKARLKGRSWKRRDIEFSLQEAAYKQGLNVVYHVATEHDSDDIVVTGHGAALPSTEFRGERTRWGLAGLASNRVRLCAVAIVLGVASLWPANELRRKRVVAESKDFGQVDGVHRVAMRIAEIEPEPVLVIGAFVLPVALVSVGTLGLLRRRVVLTLTIPILLVVLALYSFFAVGATFGEAIGMGGDDARELRTLSRLFLAVQVTLLAFGVMGLVHHFRFSWALKDARRHRKE